jgi:hypothetical protein
MTTVSAYSHTHTITYIADNILKSLKDIIAFSGLDPTNFVQDWDLYRRGISAWMQSGHLRTVQLEFIDSSTDTLITKWDIEIIYSLSNDDGRFWTDTDQLRYHLKKIGLIPSQTTYRLTVLNSDGRPDVEGWSKGKSYSTDNMVRQSLGATIGCQGMGASAAYWRRST